MKHFVITKIADHHADLLPWWYGWYRHIYRADQIIVLAAKSRRSKIEQTLAFFKPKHDVFVEPLISEFFDDDACRARLIQLVDAQVNKLHEPYSVLHADADEFFEPVRPLPDCRVSAPGIYPYRWIEIASEGMDLLTLRATWDAGWKAACLNCSTHSTIRGYGHYDGYKPMTPETFPVCFHWCYTGADDYLAKVTATNLHRDDTMTFHRGRAVDRLRTDGPDALREDYAKLIAMDSNALLKLKDATPAPQHHAQKFRGMLNRVRLIQNAQFNTPPATQAAPSPTGPVHALPPIPGLPGPVGKHPGDWEALGQPLVKREARGLAVDPLNRPPQRPKPRG